MSDFKRKVYQVSDPGLAWPVAEDLATRPGGREYLVELDGRQIEAVHLIECFQWLFGPSR